MAEPLVTKEEVSELAKRIEALKPHKGFKPGESRTIYWSQRRAMERAQLVTINKRAQERAEEFLNALIIIVGARGELYWDFYEIFADSDCDAAIEFLALHDTPEVRRQLHTILKALTEVPRTWARSAFVRFLRGIGKQKGANYYGAGMFSSSNGWKEKSITAICQIIVAEGSPHAQVLMTYEDAASEVYDAGPDDPVAEPGAEHKATRVERDVEFISNLCSMLEERGLAKVSESE